MDFALAVCHKEIILRPRLAHIRMFAEQISEWLTRIVSIKYSLWVVRLSKFWNHDMTIYYSLVNKDAAHSHSPAGGQGMNAAIQDSVCPLFLSV